MLDGSNFDPRPLRIRIVENLKYPEWMTIKELMASLSDPYYTVSAMVSKIYLYGGPIERIKAPQGGGKYLYRRKLKASA